MGPTHSTHSLPLHDALQSGSSLGYRPTGPRRSLRGSRLFRQYKMWQLSFGLETDLVVARFPSHRGYCVYSPFLLCCSPNHQ